MNRNLFVSGRSNTFDSKRTYRFFGSSDVKTGIANQTGSTIIPERRGMSRQCHKRNGGAGIDCIYGLLGVTVLLALLVARSVPPQFPTAANSASSIHAFSNHWQRPRLNFDETNWGLPTGRFQPLRYAATLRPVGPTSRLFSSLQATGLHHKRPPPVV